MKNDSIVDISGGDVFSIPGVEMRATTDYPQPDMHPSGSPDMRTPTAQSAGRSHGCTQDECGMRSAGGPQHPYGDALGVPRGTMPNNADNKTIIRPDDENG